MPTLESPSTSTEAESRRRISTSVTLTPAPPHSPFVYRGYRPNFVLAPTPTMSDISLTPAQEQESSNPVPAHGNTLESNTESTTAAIPDDIAALRRRLRLDFGISWLGVSYIFLNYHSLIRLSISSLKNQVQQQRTTRTQVPQLTGEARGKERKQKCISFIRFLFENDNLRQYILYIF